MFKIVQINSTANIGSTGRIAAELGNLAMNQGNRSFIAYGRAGQTCNSELIKFGTTTEVLLHVLKTRLFDRHGFGSKDGTAFLINKIETINPDIIHLHNIHGYYINIELLFSYLKKAGKPVIWTLHDCWPFTGHCSHFQYADCHKWESQCHHCPNKRGYPASWLIDNSYNNFIRKKALFNGCKNLTLVVPADWLKIQISDSFLGNYPVIRIYNGVDLNIYTPKENNLVKVKLGIGDQKMMLGVSNVWNRRKGLFDFYQLRQMLDKKISIVLVGLTHKQVKDLPPGIIGIERTERISDLADIYSAADVFVNPSYVDTFPNVNIEALACGTPVVTYNTGGGPEAIDQSTGIVVDYGNINELKKEIITVLKSETNYLRSNCRERAVNIFSAKERFGDYIKLYESVLEKHRIEN